MRINYFQYEVMSAKRYPLTPYGDINISIRLNITSAVHVNLDIIAMYIYYSGIYKQDLTLRITK